MLKKMFPEDGKQIKNELKWAQETDVDWTLLQHTYILYYSDEDHLHSNSEIYAN